MNKNNIISLGLTGILSFAVTVSIRRRIDQAYIKGRNDQIADDEMLIEMQNKLLEGMNKLCEKQNKTIKELLEKSKD